VILLPCEYCGAEVPWSPLLVAPPCCPRCAPHALVRAIGWSLFAAAWFAFGVWCLYRWPPP
jgi:hypothetical protein